jgi:ParB family chromosome partitioning protein
MNHELLYVGVAQIFADPTQPRKKFDPGELEKIARSLKSRGFLQPIRVCFDKERQAYRLVVGESRWRAAQIAGIEEIPCIVAEGEPDDASLLADRLIENVCRSDLRPLELARGIETLKRLRKCTSQEVAAELGISGASVSKAEALLSLPEDVQRLVDDELLAESCAYEVSKLPDEDSMRELANQIVACRLNRDQVIEAVRLKVPKRAVQRTAGRVAGKLNGVSFSFSFGAGQLTPEILLKAIEQIRGKLKELQKGESKDVSALADLLRAS